MNKATLGIVGSLLTGAMLSLSFSPAVVAQEAGRDCDSNAIVNCGALTADEMQQKFSAQGNEDVDNVFAHYGISSQDVQALDNAREGEVHKDGRVTVDGVVVGTNAKTVGRQDMTGSTAVSIGGKTYYERTPSVSFRSDSLPAFVVLKADGTLDYAIIKACGNPVTATPVVKQKEQPKPAPAAVYTCDDLTARRITRTQYRFTADSTVKNGATVTEYRYDFGDGTVVTDKNNVYTHEYKEAGTYTASVTVFFDVNGAQQQHTDAACKVSVTVDAAPVVQETKPEQPKEQGEVLPATGAAGVLGAGMGAGSIAAAGYYWYNSRRNLVSKMLKR